VQRVEHREEALARHGEDALAALLGQAVDKQRGGAARVRGHRDLSRNGASPRRLCAAAEHPARRKLRRNRLFLRQDFRRTFTLWLKKG